MFSTIDKTLFTLTSIFNLPQKTKKNFVKAPLTRTSVSTLSLLKQKGLISTFIIKHSVTQSNVWIFSPITPLNFKTSFWLLKKRRSSFRLSYKALKIFHLKMGESLILIEFPSGLTYLSSPMQCRQGGTVVGLFL